jgi:hypothetical protein
VDGLTPSAVAPVLRSEGSVGVEQPGIELIGECVAVIGHRIHLAVLDVFVSWR